MKTLTLCWFCPLRADRGPPAAVDFTCTKSSCRVSCRCGDQRGNKKPQTIETKDAPLAQLAEQLTLNQWVPGSSPGGCTTGKTASGLRKRKPEAVLLCPALQPVGWTASGIKGAIAAIPVATGE